jgi:hypothetical protein
MLTFWRPPRRLPKLVSHTDVRRASVQSPNNAPINDYVRLLGLIPKFADGQTFHGFLAIHPIDLVHTHTQQQNKIKPHASTTTYEHLYAIPPTRPNESAPTGGRAEPSLAGSPKISIRYVVTHSRGSHREHYIKHTFAPEPHSNKMNIGRFVGMCVLIDRTHICHRHPEVSGFPCFLGAMQRNPASLGPSCVFVSARMHYEFVCLNA